MGLRQALSELNVLFSPVSVLPKEREMKLPWVSRAGILTTAVMMAVAFLPSHAPAEKEPPADLCMLLSPADVEHAIGQSVNPATKSPAAKGTGKEVAGSNCVYEPKQVGTLHRILLIIYVDPSAAVAKDTFANFEKMYGVNAAVSGVGDTAYLDSAHAIHVLKDKVRYFIQISPVDSATTDKQLKDLASSVASQL
jgi:hypothetical protein